MVKDALRDLIRRTRMSIGRAVLAAINDATGLQETQIRLMQDEVKGGVAHLQSYGLTVHPLPGAEGLVLFVGGNRDHGVAIKFDDRRFRIRNLAPGEVAVYTHENLLEGGHRIVLRKNQDLEVAIGRDINSDVGRDVNETVGRDHIEEVARTWKVTAGERAEIVVGSSKIEVLPDRIRLTTPLYEAFKA
jgi:phage baseplate assembly protein V